MVAKSSEFIDSLIIVEGFKPEKYLSRPIKESKQYGSGKGEREKAKLQPFPITLSPNHNGDENFLSEPYWESTLG